MGKATGAASVARPKGKASAKVEAPEAPAFKTLGVRMTTEYAAWLERAAKFDRMSIAAFIDKAATERARAVGFTEEPPERLP